jgi:propionate catabolism operon transcriptional regulator
VKAAQREAQRPHIVFLISHLRGEAISTRLSDLIRRVLLTTEYNLRISVVDRVLDEALEYARKLEEERDVSVFICARATGYYLRKRLTTPVVLLANGGSDILDAFSKASKISPQVGLLLHRDIEEGVERTKHLFNFTLHQRSYLSGHDVPMRLQELVEEGCLVVIGSPMVTEIAQRSGVPAVLLYSTHAIKRALGDAFALCHAERVETKRRQRLDLVLRHLYEGVIATDRDGLIESVNIAAAGLLKLDRSKVIGRPISAVVPELELTPAVLAGTPDTELVVKFRGSPLVVSRIPLMEEGAFDGALITLQDTTVVQRVDRNIRLHNRRRSEIAKYHLSHLLGSDPAIVRLRHLAERYAPIGSTVLITGESGTGKELLVQGIHNYSLRRLGPFVAINCGALPETLLESELFGYEDGAFTGSRRGGKAGLFEAAHQGTIFLDEIGDMPLLLQTRLLRVLQEREIHRLGALDTTPVDVRVIAATNIDLHERVEAGLFRPDLYYRLNIVRLHIPPLRERAGDVPILAQALTEKICGQLGHEVPSQKALQPLFNRLEGYHWPGNIRELENLLERYIASFENGHPPDAMTLTMILPEQSQAVPKAALAPLKAERKAHDIEILSQAISKCGGNYKEAASMLGISYTTLWRKMKAQ